MRVGIWLAEGSWPAAVDAARELLDETTEVVLLHVAGAGAQDALAGAVGGLWGRGRRRDPVDTLTAEAVAASTTLLERAEVPPGSWRHQL